jgi:cytoskeletal protein RodZ
MKYPKNNYKNISNHLSGFMVTFGIVTLSFSILSAAFVLAYNNSDRYQVAFAQNDPTSPNAPVTPLPTATSSPASPNTTSTTSTTSSSSTTSTPITTSTTGTQNPTTPTNPSTPIPQEPEAPQIDNSDIVITPTQDGGQTESFVPSSSNTLTQADASNQQALNSSLNQATPRSGGFQFVFGGILILALALWYYYYTNQGDTKTPLKLTEKKIGKSRK